MFASETTFVARSVKQAINFLKSNNPDYPRFEFNINFLSQDLESPLLDQAAIAEIADALRSNKTITELNLSLCRLTDEDLKTLAPALAENRTLKKLDLGSNRFTDIRPLTDVLESHPSITELDLRNNNHLNVESIDAIVELLEANSPIARLNLSRCNLGAEGAPGLAQNRTLRRLAFKGNNIGDQGATAFAGMFTKNRGLFELDLAVNDIGQKGMEELGSALTAGSTLAILNITANATQFGVDCDRYFQLPESNPSRNIIDIKSIGMSSRHDALTAIVASNREKASGLIDKMRSRIEDLSREDFREIGVLLPAILSLLNGKVTEFEGIPQQDAAAMLLDVQNRASFARVEMNLPPEATRTSDSPTGRGGLAR